MIYTTTIPNIFALASNNQSLLGGDYNPISAEESAAKDAARALADNAYYKARIIAWTIWYEGYERGDIDFRELLERARASLVALGVDEFLRCKTLGLLTDKALAITPPKRKRGKSGFIDPRKSIAIQLVNLAKADGFVLSKESKNSRSAFEHVAEIMTRLGMNTSLLQVHDWCYPRMKKSRNNRIYPGLPDNIK